MLKLGTIRLILIQRSHDAMGSTPAVHNDIIGVRQRKQRKTRNTGPVGLRYSTFFRASLLTARRLYVLIDDSPAMLKSACRMGQGLAYTCCSCIGSCCLLLSYLHVHIVQRAWNAAHLRGQHHNSPGSAVVKLSPESQLLRVDL